MTDAEDELLTLTERIKRRKTELIELIQNDKFDEVAQKAYNLSIWSKRAEEIKAERMKNTNLQEVYDRFYPQMRELVMSDMAYRNACVNSDRVEAYEEGRIAVQRVALTFTQNADFMHMYFDSQEYSERMRDSLIEDTYGELKNDQSESEESGSLEGEAVSETGAAREDSIQTSFFDNFNDERPENISKTEEIQEKSDDLLSISDDEAEDFLHSYDDYYYGLYNSDNHLDGFNFNKLVDLGQEFAADESNSNFMSELIRIRSDYFTSDRECAALAMALSEYHLLDISSAIEEKDLKSENGSGSEDPQDEKANISSLNFDFDPAESGALREFADAHPNMSFALYNAVLKQLDYHYNDLGYDKTDYHISAVIDGKEYEYGRRFDIGDGKESGGRTIVDDLKSTFSSSPGSQKSQEYLDVFIPFLEKHLDLTDEEKSILQEFTETLQPETHETDFSDVIGAARDGAIIRITEKAEEETMITNARRHKISNERLAYNTDRGFFLIGDTRGIKDAIIAVYGDDEAAVRSVRNLLNDESVIDIAIERPEATEITEKSENDEDDQSESEESGSLEGEAVSETEAAEIPETPSFSEQVDTDPEKNLESEDTTVSEEETVNDKHPELRGVLNAFSEKYGLGELDVVKDSLNRPGYFGLIEKMQDGAEFHMVTLSKLHDRYNNIPLTAEDLQEALELYEKRDGNSIPSSRRPDFLEAHGGAAPLPKVRKDLPEIVYADHPSEKVRDNIDAIDELLRLEKADEAGEYPYDNFSSKSYYSKENSEERLRKYCGWGGLPQVFDEDFNAFNSCRNELKVRLTPEEYNSARESTLNAHYTPQIIIDAMYKAVQNMDLPRDAQILEPACGTGNFISRLPHSLSNAQVTGVELDSITARIAKQLNRDNPNISIIESGFEKTNFENDSFDLAIGNVPFGDYKLNDPDYTQDWLIHDAFFRKSLDKVAPGGVVAFITSSGTMDKTNPKIREYLATKAELVGAIRLPETAFSDAGTKVTSDIIFLKKRDNPLDSNDKMPDWCYTTPNEDGLRINSYFVNNPQMILGKMEKTTHFDMLTCKPFEGADLKTQLDEAIRRLNAKITVEKREKAVKKQRGSVEPWGRNFTFQVKDGKVYFHKGEEMNEVKKSSADIKKLTLLCEIRDVTRNLLDMQKTSVPDEDLIPLRSDLNRLYDSYVSQYGLISDNGVKKLFGDDADYPILVSLEQKDDQNAEDQDVGSVHKADIFFRRTVNPDTDITSVKTVEEALQVSLDRRGKPDILYMATLMQDRDYDSIFKELSDRGDIFVDPEKQLPDKPYSGVVERSEYLSGNVRMKLTIAEEYAKNDPAFSRNVSELKAVIPEDIKAEEISVRMGCTWIDTKDYTEFLKHLSGRYRYESRNCDVSFSPDTGEFSVLNAGSKKDLNVNETTTYGTKDYSMYELADKILNQSRIVVLRQVPDPNDPSKTITRTDSKATKVAIEKAKAIREEFQKWIFADDKRKAKYERRYNDIFNSLVGREYDGSKMTFPGITKLNDFELRPHQKNCIARAVYGGNTLAAHVVGAGKSAVMFSTVMKKKELGLINKACVVVPKALTEQTANEWRKIYPNARLLTVTNDDLKSEANRNLFASRVATGSYDAVIMSQEQFEKLSMSKEYQLEYLQKKLDELEDRLREIKRENGGKKDYTVKGLEKAKKKMKNRYEKIMNPKSASKEKDKLMDFEHLGFDYLVCDEAHAYKNGFVTTKMMNVAGVSTNASGRAEDMQMKTDYFNETLGQGHILFCTGTPVSNSMTELYVMTRYLRPDLLKAAGVENFDDWAATFGDVVTKNRQAADGTMKLRTSFSKFANLPELMAMYKEFADIQSANKLDLPRPELKTGKPQIIKVPASPEQKAYVKELAVRSKAIEEGKVDPHEDNLLKITGEARLVGLGNKALQSLYRKRGEELPPDFTDSEGSKVDKCIENVANIYNQTKETNGVQIIFSDIAVNSNDGNFSVYDYIRDELTKKYNIPEDEIIFAPKADAKNREDIFKDINESKYRVVIASTGTLGTGANIQKNLYALHHLDIPWKPSDFEQREGRILRQGNNNKEVEIFNYVTEGTLDSYLYQTVTDKARFIAQLMDDKCPARVSEDCDEKVLTFGEIQAAAEGNPDFKRRIELSNEISELTMLKQEYLHETSLMKDKIEKIPGQIKQQEEILTKVKSDIAAAKKYSDLRLKTNDGRIITERKDINDYLHKLTESNGNTTFEINGFQASINKAPLQDPYITVTGEAVYKCSTGQDNAQRLSNLLEKSIPDRADKIEKEITKLRQDLAQAKERVDVPFAHEDEILQKTEEFQKLEEKLSGLSVQTDDAVDADEEVTTETAEEKEEREKIYGVDADDYQPIPDDNDDNEIRPARRM